MQSLLARLSRWTGISLLVVVSASLPHAQGAWTITELGTLGGLFGDADDINDAGHVVGASNAASGNERAFLWTPSGGMVDLGTLGGLRSEARAINNAGEIVGSSSLPGQLGQLDGETHAFLRTVTGMMIDLDTLGDMFPGFGFSGANDINELGQIVGESSTPGGSHAVLWMPGGGIVDLGTLGGSQSSAWAINEAGQVVGRSQTVSGDEHAFLWTPGPGGGMVDLGTLGGSTSSAVDINEAGQVVGRAATSNGDEHAFLWTRAGGMIDLGTLGAAGSRSQAEGINDAGQIVGLFNDNDDHAFYWTAADGMIELPTLTGIESGARAINNVGQLAGYGDISTGDAHAVVWNNASTPPTPEEQIESLTTSIIALVEEGRLKSGQARGLTRPLQNALQSLAGGRTAAACSQLSDFQAEVRRKALDGALTPGEAAALSEAAATIRSALGC